MARVTLVNCMSFFGAHSLKPDFNFNSRPVYSLNSNSSPAYSDDRSPESRLDLVVRDNSRDRSSKSTDKYFPPSFREDSLTPTTETEKSAPSSFILQETSSYCLSHSLPKPIPKFSGYTENGSGSRPEQNGFGNGPKMNGFESRMREYQNHQFGGHNGVLPELSERNRNSAELHRALLVRNRSPVVGGHL